MIPQLLNQTLDSLDLRLFSHSAPSLWVSSQVSSWRKYKENFEYSKTEEYFIDIPDLGKFKLLHVGHSPYEFVFSNLEIGEIYLCNPEKFISKFAINTGQIYINFRSKFLQCQTDDYGIVKQFIQNSYSIFYEKLRQTFCKVSRADLAVDVAGVSFGWEDLKKLCTRSRKTDGLSSFCTLKDLQAVRDVLSKLRPQNGNKGASNCITPEKQLKAPILTPKQIDILLELTNQAIEDPSMSRAIFGQDLQTAYIGRFGSKIYARIYCKTSEIKISGKDYLERFWKEKGWQPEEKVWRTEFSLSGDFLKEFLISDLNPDDFIVFAAQAHYSSVEKSFKQVEKNAYADFGRNLHDFDTFIENLQKLWTYCTQNWLRHTTGDKNQKDRSPNSEFWDCVSSAFIPIDSDDNHNFCRLPLPAPPTETLAGQLISQGKGCMKTVLALLLGGWHKAFGFPQTEQREYIPALIQVLAQELIEELTFEEVTYRRDRYGCDDFTDTAFSTALRAHRLKLGRGS